MVMSIQTLYTLLSLPHTHTHTHTLPLHTHTHTQLLQLQQATQGATANNSFGLGTSLGNSKPSEPYTTTQQAMTPPTPPSPQT